MLITVQDHLCSRLLARFTIHDSSFNFHSPFSQLRLQYCRVLCYTTLYYSILYCTWDFATVLISRTVDLEDYRWVLEERAQLCRVVGTSHENHPNWDRVFFEYFSSIFAWRIAETPDSCAPSFEDESTQPNATQRHTRSLETRFEPCICFSAALRLSTHSSHHYTI